MHPKSKQHMSDIPRTFRKIDDTVKHDVPGMFRKIDDTVNRVISIAREVLKRLTMPEYRDTYIYKKENVIHALYVCIKYLFNTDKGRVDANVFGILNQYLAHANAYLSVLTDTMNKLSKTGPGRVSLDEIPGVDPDDLEIALNKWNRYGSRIELLHVYETAQIAATQLNMPFLGRDVINFYALTVEKIQYYANYLIAFSRLGQYPNNASVLQELRIQEDMLLQKEVVLFTMAHAVQSVLEEARKKPRMRPGAAHSSKPIGKGGFGAVYCPPIPSGNSPTPHRRGTVGKVFDDSQEYYRELMMAKVVEDRVNHDGTLFAKFRAADRLQFESGPEVMQLRYGHAGVSMYNACLYMTLHDLCERYADFIDRYMDVMYDSDYVHLDIKPDNLTYSPDDKKIHLIDLSYMMNMWLVFEERPVWKELTSYKYFAPEYFAHEKHIRSDAELFASKQNYAEYIQTPWIRDELSAKNIQSRVARMFGDGTTLVPSDVERLDLIPHAADYWAIGITLISLVDRILSTPVEKKQRISEEMARRIVYAAAAKTLVPNRMRNIEELAKRLREIARDPSYGPRDTQFSVWGEKAIVKIVNEHLCTTPRTSAVERPRTSAVERPRTSATAPARASAADRSRSTLVCKGREKEDCTEPCKWVNGRVRKYCRKSRK